MWELLNYMTNSLDFPIFHDEVQTQLAAKKLFWSFYHFDGISPTQSAISSLRVKEKKKKVKGSSHLDFHSKMSSMEFSRKANPSNSVKSVGVCIIY